MARRDVDVVIGARTDDASFQRAQQRTGEFLRQIAGKGGGGVVEQTAALHHNLQRISAAGDMAKTALAGIDGIMKGAAGDSEGMVESFKQLGFGIGEVVNQFDRLAETLSNRIFKVTQDMLDEEESLNNAHEKRRSLQREQNALAEQARGKMLEMVRGQSRELALLESASDADRDRIERNQRLADIQAEVSRMLVVTGRDVGEADREHAEALARQIMLNADIIEQRKQEKAEADAVQKIQEKIDAARLSEQSESRLFGLEGDDREIETIKLRTEARERELQVLREQAKTDKQRAEIDAIIAGVRERAKLEIAAVGADDEPQIQQRFALQLPSITSGSLLGGFAQAAQAGGEFRVEERRIASATKDNTAQTVAVLRELLSISRSRGFTPILN